MIEIQVKSDVERVLNKFRNLNQAEVAKVTARAINRVMSSARTVAIKEVRKKYNISPKYFREKIGDKDNRYNALKVWKAYPRTLTATLRAYGKRIPLIAFPATQTDKGVEVSIMKGGGSQLIRSAFISQVKSGHRSVFARGKYGDGKFIFREKRIKKFPLPDLPITRLSTVSTRTAVVEPSVLSAMKVKVESDMGKRLEHEIHYLLSKR